MKGLAPSYLPQLAEGATHGRNVGISRFLYRSLSPEMLYIPTLNAHKFNHHGAHGFDYIIVLAQLAHQLY